jgi:hypothetical protein
MKKILLIITIISTVNLFGASIICSGENNKMVITSDNEIITITGTMMLKGDAWVIHGTEGKTGELKDYYPTNLGQEFRIEGQRVMVEASVDPIPENVRMAGTPITIIKMTRI